MPALIILALLVACAQPSEPHIKYGLTSHIKLTDEQWEEYKSMHECRQTSPNWWRCEGANTWGETWIDENQNNYEGKSK